MFDYSDPVGTGLLEQTGALAHYRAELHSDYLGFARLGDSAFTLLSAFDAVDPADLSIDAVPWVAYPKSVGRPDTTIDSQRTRWQDEYVEWNAETDSNGRLTRVSFTTEFSEYYEAFAAVGFDALAEAIREIYPQADPAVEQLFGPQFDPATASSEARARRFRLASTLQNGANLSFVLNPWNNNQEGILCLSQRFNTLGALFNLVGRCGVANIGLDPSDVCASVGGACGPNRNSDPKVCTASQQLSRSRRSLSLHDPAGIRISHLTGIWKLNGQQVDINDANQNNGVWTISRNGRRAALDLTQPVTMGDDPIVTGTQVSRALIVEALVISAADDVLSELFRAGNESRI